MANNFILLRRAWLMYDVLIIWMASCCLGCFSYNKASDDINFIFLSSLFIAWIYFCIYPSFKDIFLKTFLVWLGWFLGFDSEGTGLSHTFYWLKHVLFENHSFWLSEKPYMLMLIIFIVMLFNWIFAQIILKVISYFRGKKDRLL